MSASQRVLGRILIVDDDPAIRDALSERFRARGHDVREASTGKQAIAAARLGVDVMLLDLQMPDGDGFEVLSQLQGEELAPSVIVMTAHGSVERAVRALQLGAYDFIEKPFDPPRLEERVARALERVQLLRSKAALADEQEVGILHEGEPMEGLLAIARKAALADATVLLTGESGTGKEVLARSIHAWSSRTKGPFVAVHCAALPEALFESELFGHEKGSFTGANARRLGRFESAQGGTLFLDEVGELPLGMQVKLLRVLQERSFYRVGGDGEVRVDVRIVAATNRNLAKAVAAGDFREDLFYRINTITLELPPLRERKRDLVVLAAHFLEQCAHQAGQHAPTLAPEAQAAMRAHAWPGNVRELRNAMERAIVLGQGQEVCMEDLPPEIMQPLDQIEGAGYHAKVETFRAQVLFEALEQASGSRTEAARALGLQRTYLARLIKRYELGN